MLTIRGWTATLLAASVLHAACSGGVDVSSTTTGAGGGVGGVGGPPPECPNPTDTDGDGVVDWLEPGDTDGDGIPDANSTDSDADGYPDSLEAGIDDFPRASPCDALVDTDGDGVPDMTDLDADDDGLLDATEQAYDADGSKDCWRRLDCDGDGVIDLVEVGAGTDPADAGSVPVGPAFWVVLPYNKGERTIDLTFSTGFPKADLYFLADATVSMAPVMDALKSGIDSTVQAILNGDQNAMPAPIPPIPDAWFGVGAVRDVPWSPYGQSGDELYLNRFQVGGQAMLGNVAEAVNGGASANLKAILGALGPTGGGDGPEALTQALWIAATNQPYEVTGEGTWSSIAAQCDSPGMVGIPCFRPQAQPVFVVITDAATHNGPASAGNQYDPGKAGGTKSYGDVVQAIKSIDARVVGLPCAGGSPGQARSDLSAIATDSGSLYFDELTQSVKPLVSADDVVPGALPAEIAGLIGSLVGAGLRDVTTAKSSYGCVGGTDCDGDGSIEISELQSYENPILAPDTTPFDASKLITWIEPLASPSPAPYESLDTTSFNGVHGDQQLTFRVHAENTVIDASSLVVLRALIRVTTPHGRPLGKQGGVQVVYFIIPPPPGNSP